jgi:hypothetical protein
LIPEKKQLEIYCKLPVQQTLANFTTDTSYSDNKLDSQLLIIYYTTIIRVIYFQVPEENCNLEPQRTCKQITKLVPLLKAGEECVDIPKEVCSRFKLKHVFVFNIFFI